ncbi:putative ynaE [Bacillus clarus]|uniref:Putative ynaE n=1 Tax=Bacillus clarus TaxID=2338372 RepID=A0A090YP50_9BACI|nr:putative ynaE [Bacillus clarus]
MQLKEYMNHTFPGVTLVPYIFFQWENHLHFDFGKDTYQIKEGSEDLNMEYFSQLYKYNKCLFEDIFSKKTRCF